MNLRFGEYIWYFELVIDKVPILWKNTNLGGRGRKYPFLGKQKYFR